MSTIDDASIYGHTGVVQASAPQKITEKSGATFKIP
jgi:hypothetical protein